MPSPSKSKYSSTHCRKAGSGKARAAGPFSPSDFSHPAQNTVCKSKRYEKYFIAPPIYPAESRIRSGPFPLICQIYKRFYKDTSLPEALSAHATSFFVAKLDAMR